MTINPKPILFSATLAFIAIAVAGVQWTTAITNSDQYLSDMIGTLEEKFPNDVSQDTRLDMGLTELRLTTPSIENPDCSYSAVAFHGVGAIRTEIKTSKLCP